MGFLSGIVHAIGSGIGDVENWFSGDNKKKQQNQPQQQQQSQQVQQQAQNPFQNNNNQQNYSNPQKQQSQTLQTPTEANVVNLLHIQPNQLAKAAPAAAPSQPQNTDHRNFFQKAFDQINPLDSDRTFQNGAPTQAKLQESAIHQVTHNPVNNTIGSLANNITGSSSLIDAGRLGVAELTHNQPAIDNATTSLSKNITNFIPVGAANSFKNGFGQDIATAATTPFAENSAKQQADYVRQQLNNKTGNVVHDSAVEAYASSVENQLLNEHLQTAGIDQSTPLNKVIKKVGGDAASTAANIALLDMPTGGVLTDEAGNAVKNAAGNVVRKSFSAPVKAAIGGTANATAAVGGTIAANPDASAGDLVKAGAKAFVPGAILPFAMEKLQGGSEVASGVKPGNTDAPLEVAPPQAPAAPLEVAGPNGERVPQVSAEAPNAVQPVIHAGDPIRTELENAANDTNVPSYQRVAAKNQLAEYEAQQEAVQQRALGVQDNPAVDSPSYQRQGKVLPSEAPPTPAAINDGLNNNAAEIAKDPANADMVNQAYRTTGSSNPLSLIAHTLSNLTSKVSVRELVQKLIPEAKGNTLNRMVNSIVGADNQADVLQALHEGSADANTAVGPLGKVSTEGAPEPTSSTPLQATTDGSNIDQPVQPATQPQQPLRATEAPQTVQPASSPLNTSEKSAPATASQELQPAQAPLQGSELNTSNTSSPPNVAQPTPNVNTNEGNGTSFADEGLKNSKFNQAVVDNTTDPVFKAAYQSDPITKGDAASLTDLQTKATAKVSPMSLPELVEHYGKDFEPDHTPITSPSQYYEALQALRQLEQFAGDPTAADAAANALRGVNEYAYNQGRGLAATKVAYDNLPTSMKVQYISKLVQKLGGELNDADLAKLMSAADDQGKLAAIAQKATQAANELSTHATDTGTRDGSFNDQMKQILKAEDDANSKMYDANRAVVDIIDKNLPKSSFADRLAQSARTSMLSSVGGRAFALINTSVNTALDMTDRSLSSVYGRGINAVTKALGKNTDTNQVTTALPNASTLVKGAGEGVKGLVKEVGGNAPVKDVTAYLKGEPDGEYSHDNTRYGFFGRNISAPFRKVVRLGVGSHLALTKGVENVALEQAGREAAKASNVPAENLQGFLDFYKSHPPTDVAAQAKEAWLGVNNLQKNGISNAFQKMAGALETAAGKSPGKSGDLLQGAAKQVRTVMIPFSHYMGGFVSKALTDRNMLYNSFKIAQALKNGDTQVLSDQLAHLTTNTGLSVGLGYTLAANGLITDKNQSGKNYDGLYFHMPGSNRYIPLGITGQASIPIAMGATFHQSMNDGSSGGSFPKNMGDNFMKITGLAGSFGSNNNVITALSGNTGASVPKIIESGVQQHIPGVFGDVNALINQFGGDKTHEAPLTKAQTLNSKTGNTVTDNTKTLLNKFESSIPGLSQTMPRDTGVRAPTEEDRALHAGNASSQQAQALANAQATPTVNLKKQQVQLKLDKATFEASGKQNSTINGNVYEKDSNGKTVVTKQADYNFLTQNGGVSPAQRGIDTEAFKNSGKQIDTIHGIVYQRSDDGKVVPMEQKDYDYNKADTGMSDAQKAGDYSGYKQHSSDLLKNISDQLQNPHLSESQIKTLTSKALAVQDKAAEYNHYNGFANPDPKNIETFKHFGQINNAKGDWSEQIQRNAAKYNVDANALLAVASQEGLGGGVGDGGHAFGPFQMNDAGGVLTGKFKSPAEARAYAESPQGIEDAIKQIAGVASGLKGKDAIAAIVSKFERPADPNKEIAGAGELYDGGTANLSSDGSGTSVIQDADKAAKASAAATKAADLIKSNTVTASPNLTASSLGKLTAAKVSTAVPILQKLIPSDLVKKRSISVATVHP